jgi:NADH-quinone oxidoreductase subunit K
VDSLQLLGWSAVAMFAMGLLGVIVRRNVLVMLMCMELMLNAVNLSLVVFGRGDPAAATVLVFLVFVVAAAEIAIAIPIVLLLVRRKRSLDLGRYSELHG